jgi:hypothetical protein
MTADRMAILRECAAPHTLVCDAVTTSRHTADKLSKPRFVLCPCYYLRLDADTEVCLWHKADVQNALMKSALVTRCLILTRNGHSRGWAVLETSG